MKFDQFGELVNDMRRGCMNRLGDMQNSSDVDEYNWYAKTHNELNGTFMALQAEYYNDETGDD